MCLGSCSRLLQAPTEFILHKGKTAAWDSNQAKQASRAWQPADTS